MTEEPTVEEIMKEIRKEVPLLMPQVGRELGRAIVEIADGACEELVEKGIYSDKKTCVISILKGHLT